MEKEIMKKKKVTKEKHLKFIYICDFSQAMTILLGQLVHQ